MAFAAGSTNKAMSKVFSNKTTGFGRTSTLTTLPRETNQPLLIEVVFFLALLHNIETIVPHARWRLPEHPRRSKERRWERTWTAPRCWSLWVSCFSACLYSLIFEVVFSTPVISTLRFIISLVCAGTRTSPPVAKASQSPSPDLSSDLWLDSKVELAILNLTKQFYLRTCSGGSDEDVDDDVDDDYHPQ